MSYRPLAAGDTRTPRTPRHRRDTESRAVLLFLLAYEGGTTTCVHPSGTDPELGARNAYLGSKSTLCNMRVTLLDAANHACSMTQ